MPKSFVFRILFVYLHIGNNETTEITNKELLKSFSGSNILKKIWKQK